MSYNERVSRAIELMEADGVDVLLLARPSESRSLYYLTGIDRFCADLLLFRDGSSIMLVLDQDLLDAEERAQVDEIKTFTSFKSQFEVIAKALGMRRLEHGVVGVEKAFLHASFYEALREAIPRSLKIADASKVTGELRLTKTDDEINLISQASAIASKALKAAADVVRPGTGENEIAGFIEYELRRAGAEGTAMSTFVSSGSGTRASHPPASTKRLNRNEIVTVDLHPRFRGYCSDLAATFAVDQDRRLCDAVSLLLEIRDAAIQDIRIGDKFSTIHRRYLRLLAGSGFTAQRVPFFNNLHGVGVAVEDPPSFWYPFDVEIRPGMVFAFAQSPAAMRSGDFGVRFEDTYVVTRSGVDRLTLSVI
ncbi:aminopeptidase P family protein [Candidatus Bathyarchaeota archaeon]|nr:aminopeptidase P family protein [Candidatus Bathyarchaeota archaeon]